MIHIVITVRIVLWIRWFNTFFVRPNPLRTYTRLVNEHRTVWREGSAQCKTNTLRLRGRTGRSASFLIMRCTAAACGPAAFATHRTVSEESGFALPIPTRSFSTWTSRICVYVLNTQTQSFRENNSTVTRIEPTSLLVPKAAPQYRPNSAKDIAVLNPPVTLSHRHPPLSALRDYVSRYHTLISEKQVSLLMKLHIRFILLIHRKMLIDTLQEISSI